MRKTWLIAAREYAAAVRTKSFVLTLVLLPVLMVGGAAVGAWTNSAVDLRPKRVAVLDRTPGAAVYAAIQSATRQRDAEIAADAEKGDRKPRPPFVFERVDPAPTSDPAAVAAQRYDLSQRVRDGDLLAYTEVGADVLSPRLDYLGVLSSLAGIGQAGGDVRNLTPQQQREAAEKIFGPGVNVTYTTARPTYLDVRNFIQQSILLPIYQARIESAGLPAQKVLPLLVPPIVTGRGLYEAGPTTRPAGATADQPTFREASGAGQIAVFLVPVALLMLLFTVVFVGVSPLTTNVIEEKQQRIAEVLLGGVRPFDLMLGKLLGGVAVALTLAAVYLAGAYGTAWYYGVAGYVAPSVLAWFLVFAVLASLLYGAFFAAAGAAVTDVKEAQTLITPVMLLISGPLVIFGKVLEDPNGPLPTWLTFFPPATPLLTVFRLAVPPGPPQWQVVAAALLTLATTAVVVWVAGRIFRVGLLAAGKAATPADLLRWTFGRA